MREREPVPQEALHGDQATHSDMVQVEASGGQEGATGRRELRGGRRFVVHDQTSKEMQNQTFGIWNFTERSFDPMPRLWRRRREAALGPSVSEVNVVQTVVGILTMKQANQASCKNK